MKHLEEIVILLNLHFEFRSIGAYDYHKEDCSICYLESNNRENSY